jgi:hypothetical protein
MPDSGNFSGCPFVMSAASASELLSEADKAAEFYLNHFPFATLEDIGKAFFTALVSI